MTKQSFHRLLMLTTALLLIFTTVFQGTLTTQAQTKKPKVGLVMKSLANEFFKQMQAGAEEYAKANADKFDFSAVGMKDERDFAAQVDAVENFITQKYDIIVIAPADSKAMVTPLAKAIKAGIVVINIDVELDAAAKKAAGIDLAFFGPDNRAGAKLAGDALAKKLGEGGKVVILEGNPEADNAVQRKLGFEDSIKEGKLTLLDSKTAHWETEEANTLATNFLTQYPDLQGIMAANDSMALGAVKAVEAAGLAGKVQIVGFDNIPAVQPLIKEGKMLATVEQYGAKMAAMGIDYGLRTLAGETFTGWVKTDVTLVTDRTFMKPKVGLVMKSLANEFFKQMQAGAEEYAKANADKFEFTAVGMKDERDFAAQVDAVENFITQKYDIIVIAPADSKAMVTPIAKAIKAGIVVINIDVELDAEAKKAAGIDLAFFGPDNRAGAKLAGDALAQKLGKGGKVVILEGNPEADNAVQRKLGFEDSIKEGGLTLLDSKTAHWETEEANTLATNFLTQYPDLQGIMAANDSMALGAVKAVEAAGLTGKVQVVGFDNIPAVQPLIKEGKMLATVEQYGAQMAALGIDYGIRTFRGETFTGWVKTDIKLITAAELQ